MQADVLAHAHAGLMTGIFRLVANGMQIVEEEGWRALFVQTLISSLESIGNGVVVYGPVVLDMAGRAAFFVYLQAKVCKSVARLLMWCCRAFHGEPVR